MRRTWWWCGLWFASSCAIKAPRVDTAGDPPIGLTLQAPACLIANTSDPFSFALTVRAAATIVVEVDAQDGSRTVVFRQQIAAATGATVIIPAQTFGAGDNNVSVWSYASAHASQTDTFIVHAVAVRDPLAPDTDADGDCWTVRDGDCDDHNPAVHPGAVEICNNGIDDNCNGLTDTKDPACIVCTDSDGDGYTSIACGGRDCDDSNAAVNPGAVELCNGIDDNCDGKIDEAFDADGDGFVACPAGTAYVPTRQVDGHGCPGEFTSAISAAGTCPDCDDSDPTTYPGAFETCDSKLHSCDANATVADKQADDDGDGYVNCEDPDSDNDGWCDFAAPASLVQACADPAQPDGLCCRGVDDCKHVQDFVQSDADGDGQGDACDTCTDADGDGYGRGGTYAPVNPANFSPIAAADGHPVVVRTAGTFSRTGCAMSAVDCSDDPTTHSKASTVHPGAIDGPADPASCDGVDNNCDGKIDEGFDVDGDTWTTCTGTTHVRSNGVITSGALDADDCDDHSSVIHPAALETDVVSGNFACDGLDNNCNGSVDEQFDADGDTWTTCTGTSHMRTNGISTVSTNGDANDCNDDPADHGTEMFPGNPEVCDGLDNDCSCPYGKFGYVSNWPPPPNGFTNIFCIDEGWDPDGDGFAGVMNEPPGAACPLDLMYNEHGQTCVGGSCYDCDQCGSYLQPSCGPTPDGSTVYPTATGAASTESTSVDGSCTDTVDNDCNGLADDADPQCQ